MLHRRRSQLRCAWLPQAADSSMNQAGSMGNLSWMCNARKLASVVASQASCCAARPHDDAFPQQTSVNAQTNAKMQHAVIVLPWCTGSEHRRPQQLRECALVGSAHGSWQLHWRWHAPPCLPMHACSLQPIHPQCRQSSGEAHATYFAAAQALSEVVNRPNHPVWCSGSSSSSSIIIIIISSSSSSSANA